MRALHGVLVVAAAMCSCSKARPLQGELADPVSWEEDIAPLFAVNCSACHSGATAAAGYRTTSYLEALGPQSAPVAVAGDASSLLLRTIDPARADAVHAPVAGAYGQTRAWVVDGRLSFFRSGIHEGGILNPRDSEFHSNLVRASDWNFANCQHCHGDDLSGGKAGVSCQQCHSLQVPAGGTPTCSSCHGSAQSPAPPRDLSGSSIPSARGVGAHQAHLFGKTLISAPIACETCHHVPAKVDSPGHLDHPRPATVTFSGLALADGATPAWNGASCSATYCHGGGTKLAGDPAASLRTPVWTLGTSQVFCGSCHGAPPGTAVHAGITFPDCARCHTSTVDPTGLILISGPPDARTSTHINGVIDVTP
jgi:predicted CxxxxCH...CXXCH cytochrome family protein